MWSEILRPILRWPLRSPLRLLASIAAALVLIFGLGSLNLDPPPDDTARTST